MKSVNSTNFKYKITTNLHGKLYSANYKNYTTATAIYTAATSKKACSQLDRNVVYSQLWMDTDIFNLQI